MDFLQRTPFFRLLLPFIIGIVLYQYVWLFDVTLAVLMALSCLLMVLSFAIRVPKLHYKFRWLFGCGIFLFMFVLSYLLSGAQEREMYFSHLNKKGIYNVELIGAPIQKLNSYLCKVDVVECFESNTWQPAHGKAILYFQKDQRAAKLLVGDRLMLRATFTPPEKKLNPDGFDYAGYLKRQGIGATCYISSESWQLFGNKTSFSVQREADKWRNYLLNVYKHFKIEGDDFAVLAALTLGYTDDLQPDLRASYSATGAMHILSVSGMHVSIVYVVMAFLLSFLNKNQRRKVTKALLITLFLWAYAFITGLSPAVIRATLMFSFVAIATCFERKSQMYNTIFMSALLMLLYNPNFLFDVGFQLSYSAVLSIIFFQPAISRFYHPTNRLSRLTWNLLSVSIAAQLGTTPFTLYYFHQFPNYFLLTNLVAIPLSTIVIYLAIALLMFSAIPYLSMVVAFLLKWALYLLNFLIVWIQHLPYSLWYVSVDLKQTIILFVSIFCISLYFYTKKYSTLVLGLFAFFLSCSFSLQVNYNTLTSKRMIVFAGQKHTHVNFIQRNSNFVFSTDSVECERIAKPFWQNNMLQPPQYLNENKWVADGFVSFEGARILILNKSFLDKRTSGSPLSLDYLIIGESLKPKIEQVLQNFRPKMIIVDKSISKWYAARIKKVCKGQRIRFYSVLEEGAYMSNFSD